MEIKDQISEDLWNVIKDNYVTGNYTSAITNLFHHINEVVREKSGINADNTRLMNEAFSVKNPILKINSNQTQTEKDEQEGVGYLLKGLCLAVRNPRSHKIIVDEKNTADKILLFIDYVMSFVRNSKQSILIEDWLSFVNNEYFNEDDKYLDLVFEEIPEKKRFEVLLTFFKNRKNLKQKKVQQLINKLLASLTPEEFDEFISYINKDLINCKDDKELTMFLFLYPPDKWLELKNIVRLRIEKMIEKSIIEGKIEFGECNSNGCLATWARNFIEHFETKDKILIALGTKLSSEDRCERLYVLKFYINEVSNNSLTNYYIIQGIKSSFAVFFDREIYNFYFEYGFYDEDKKFKKKFEKEIEIAKKHFDEIETKISKDLTSNPNFEDYDFIPEALENES